MGDELIKVEAQPLATPSMPAIILAAGNAAGFAYAEFFEKTDRKREHSQVLSSHRKLLPGLARGPRAPSTRETSDRNSVAASCGVALSSTIPKNSNAP